MIMWDEGEVLVPASVANRVCAAFLGVVAAAELVLGVGYLSDEYESDVAGASILVMALLFAVMAIRMARSAAVATSDALVVRNVAWTWHIPWSDIAGFMRRSGFRTGGQTVIYVERRSGRPIRLESSSWLPVDDLDAAFARLNQAVAAIR
jgi:hypothetical protein